MGLFTANAAAGGARGALAALAGRSLDNGDGDDTVRCKSREWVERDPETPPAAIPVYHDHGRCPIAQETGRLRNVERREAAGHAVPCHRCVVPSDHGDALDGPADVVDALGDAAPEPAARAARRERAGDDT
jgi:hypothetical protein